jgi:cysteine desulfurase
VLSTLTSVYARTEILKVNEEGQIPDSEWDRFFSSVEKSNDDFCLTLQVGNNETGVGFDLQKPLEKLKQINFEGERKKWVHLDMAQSLGKISETYLGSLMELATFASFSAHKMGAPSGVGALWCKSLGCFKPMITGGGQEEGLRSGTWNALGAYGFLKAIEDWKLHGEAYRKHLRDLRDQALTRLSKLKGFKLHGHADKNPRGSLPNTLNFSFANLDTDTLIPSLDLAGFRVSGTSACSSGAQKSSHVVLAMGYGDRVAKNSIRLSLGVESTRDEVNAFCDFLASKVPSP